MCPIMSPNLPEPKAPLWGCLQTEQGLAPEPLPEIQALDAGFGNRLKKITKKLEHRNLAAAGWGPLQTVTSAGPFRNPASTRTN